MASAWCLDCGIDDQNELCIATHNTIITCVEDHVMCEEAHALKQCDEHKNPPCPEPGSGRNDPYLKDPDVQE